MANWTSTWVMVKGTPKSLEKFNTILKGEDKRQKWLPRTELIWSDTSKGEFCVQCAWSVMSCWLNGYTQEIRTKPEMFYQMTPQRAKLVRTILELSKELGLELKILSEEPGCCFIEFYHIDNGKLLEEQTYDTEGFEDIEAETEALYEELELTKMVW